MNITMKGDVDMKCLNVNTCGCVCSLRAPGGLQDRFQHVGHGREPNGGQDGVPGGERFTFDYATSRPSPSVHFLYSLLKFLSSFFFFKARGNLPQEKG